MHFLSNKEYLGLLHIMNINGFSIKFDEDGNLFFKKDFFMINELTYRFKSYQGSNSQMNRICLELFEYYKFFNSLNIINIDIKESQKQEFIDRNLVFGNDVVYIPDKIINTINNFLLFINSVYDTFMDTLYYKPLADKPFYKNSLGNLLSVFLLLISYIRELHLLETFEMDVEEEMWLLMNNYIPVSLENLK